jgi:hypothetical protein
MLRHLLRGREELKQDRSQLPNYVGFVMTPLLIALIIPASGARRRPITAR